MDATIEGEAEFEDGEHHVVGWVAGLPIEALVLPECDPKRTTASLSLGAEDPRPRIVVTCEADEKSEAHVPRGNERLAIPHESYVVGTWSTGKDPGRGDGPRSQRGRGGSAVLLCCRGAPMSRPNAPIEHRRRARHQSDAGDGLHRGQHQGVDLRLVRRALDKSSTELTDAHRHFIERSPFLVIGSHGPAGADPSPRGDQPGFVKIIDSRTVAIPDRVGNRRIDTFTNVLANPAVALIFFISGVNETLRVSGNAHISAEPALLAELAHDGCGPTTVLVIEVTEAFHKCVRALLRAQLWNPEVFAGPGFPRISKTPESTYYYRLPERSATPTPDISRS